MSRQIPKEWIKSPFRYIEEYKEGVLFFVNFAMANAQPGATMCTCPCKTCNNAKWRTFKNVERHLILNGMHPMYDDWFLHGENPNMIWPEHLVEHRRTLSENVETGNIHDKEVALEKWDAIVAAETRRKATSADEHDSDIDTDIEHDELVEVFGPDKNSRCRAMCSNSSMKKVKFQQVVNEITRQKSVMHEEYQVRMEATVKATLEAYVRATVDADVKESMKELATLIGIQKSMKEGASNQAGDTTRTEGASNSFRDQIVGKNFNTTIERVSNHTPTSGRQYVMLLSRDEKEVAKGYIANRDICHGRKVARDERVVWVTEVKDPEAAIYEAPQDGNYKLCELVGGGFLIWLEGRLRYL